MLVKQRIVAKTLFLGQDDQSALHAYHDQGVGTALHDDRALWTALYGDLSGWSVLGNGTNKRQASRSIQVLTNSGGGGEMADGELEALLENPAIILKSCQALCDACQRPSILCPETHGFDTILVLLLRENHLNDVPDYRQAPAKTALSEN